MITELKTNLPSKLNWKYICKKAIKLFWTENLQKMLQDKTSLRNVNTKDLKVGSTHLVWTSLPSNVADIRKGITKCRMLTGTYLVQKDKHRFSNGRVDPICPLCGVGDEDIEHMLTRCSALHCIRKDQFTRFKELVISYIGTDAWSQTFNSMQSLVKLILDCTTFGYLFDSDTKLKNIMLQSTELCYKMHVHRVWKMKDYE